MLVDPGLIFLGLCLILGLIAIVFLLICLPSHGDDTAEQYADRAALGQRNSSKSIGPFRRLLWYLGLRR